MKTTLLRRALVGFVAVLAMTFGAVMSSSPAQAAWGTQFPVTIQVTGAGQQLGYATGWVQFDTGGTTFQYSVTVCRQSSYTTPTLTVAVNSTGSNPNGTVVATHNSSAWSPPGTAPCYGSSWTFTGVQAYSPLSNVYFKLAGNTFVNGNNFTVFTQDRLVYKQY
ncbi:hypothetical protein [Glycomyces paridis]|uniref:Uncharacterized protein n=1 Tax=Glycomyces paridis TaxID=2126555 RepID=A0A4V4HNM2_9ACTN|nr:hypothetical protein [Glycomyces paridis]THV26676.1 hypothetical protein E9998_16910 [Glycomyces paridis]